MNKSIVLTLLLAIPGPGLAETKYANAKVERLETCKSDGLVYLYLKEIAGTTPSASNGCSNDLNIPFVKLNAVASEISEIEKLMFSIALSALVSERQVRLRFDDVTKNLASVALD